MSGVGSLMLLDTASLYYRAFFGVPETVRAPDGTPVNAIRGLLDMISRLVRARHPARLVACLDADWRPAFRVAALPSYKAHRASADGEQEEVPPAAALVRAFGSIDAICEAIDKGHGGFPAGARAKLEAARDYLAVAPTVVRVAADAPVPEVDGGLPVSPVDPAALTDLDARFGLGSSLRRAVA